MTITTGYPIIIVQYCNVTWLVKKKLWLNMKKIGDRMRVRRPRKTRGIGVETWGVGGTRVYEISGRKAVSTSESFHRRSQFRVTASIFFKS